MKIRFEFEDNHNQLKYFVTDSASKTEALEKLFDKFWYIYNLQAWEIINSNYIKFI